MAASGSAQPVTPPKAAAPAPVAPAYPKWFSRPPALRPAGEHAPSAPTAPKAKAKKRSNRGPSQEWREGNRFRAMSELKDQEAAAAQQHVVQTQRDAFSETLQRQKAYYENKIQEYSLSLAANQQLQEDHSKMKQELTEAKVTYSKRTCRSKGPTMTSRLRATRRPTSGFWNSTRRPNRTSRSWRKPRQATRKSCRGPGLTMKRK